jgi:hypothetical protein
MRFAVTMMEPSSDKIRVSYLHCALSHILQYFIHSAMDNFAMQGRSEFPSSHDLNGQNNRELFKERHRRRK